MTAKYAPEFNDMELVWRDLKAHRLAHQTFADADALDRVPMPSPTSIRSA